MRTLTLPADAFDDDALFSLIVKSYRGTDRRIRAYLFRDAQAGKVWIMQQTACMKDHYTAQDRATTARLETETPVRDGDIVRFNGQSYRVKVVGNYADAGYLIAI